MSDLVFDGNFNSPQPVGLPRITYPIANITSLYIVTQRYMQRAVAYLAPDFSLQHHIYPNASFAEESSFTNLGGGVVEFTWKFVKADITIKRPVQEAVTFPGYLERTVDYEEQYVIEEENDDGTVTEINKTRTQTAHDVILRKPFTKLVDCIQTIEYKNIFTGTRQSVANYTRAGLSGNVKFGDTTAKIEFSEGGDAVAVLPDGSEITISPDENGNYNIPQTTSGSVYYDDDSVEIKHPEEYLLNSKDTFEASIESHYGSNQHSGSKGFTMPTPTSTTDQPTNYLASDTQPTMAEYIKKVDDAEARVLTRPTVVEQFIGTVYKVTETRTAYL